MFDLLVRRGRVVREHGVQEHGVQERSIAIVDGSVAAVLSGGEEPSAREIIDANEKLVLPGIVDFHDAYLGGDGADSTDDPWGCQEN
jgi:imidazolonepropionase-like amidohydrolase